MAHTSGPWSARDIGGGQMVVEDDDTGEIVCRIEPWSPEIDLADARLIAAAPELLEAAQAALSRLELDALPRRGTAANSYRDQQALLSKLRAAIAKAKGDT